MSNTERWRNLGLSGVPILGNYINFNGENMNKPEPNKLYALTGGTGKPCIANGNTWEESEVKSKCNRCGVVVFPEDDNCCDRCLELSFNEE